MFCLWMTFFKRSSQFRSRVRRVPSALGCAPSQLRPQQDRGQRRHRAQQGTRVNRKFFWPQFRLEKWLDIPFWFWDLYKLPIFELFLSVSNLKPKLKWFFKSKIKLNLLNRPQDERGAARAALLPEGNAARRAAAARGKEEPFLAVIRAGIGTESKPIELLYPLVARMKMQPTYPHWVTLRPTTFLL